MPDSTCKDCGRPVKRVTLLPTRMLVDLDTTPSHDGRYRLKGDQNSSAEPIDRPGFQGYQLHSDTCPKQQHVGR